MALLELVDQRKIDPGSTPLTRGKTGFSDVLDAAFDATADNFNTISRDKMLLEESQDNRRTYREITGEELKPSLAEGYVAPEQPSFWESLFEADPLRGDLVRQERIIKESEHEEKFINKAIDQLKQQDPEKFKRLKTRDQQVESAAKRALDSQRKLADTMKRASGFDAVTGLVLGSGGAMLTDPINLAAFVGTAGIGSASFAAARAGGMSVSRAILGEVLIEAGVAAGVETVSQPTIAQWQREIGNEYGFTEAAQNVGLAALFAGGITGAMRGAKPTASFLFNRVSEVSKASGQTKIAAKYMSRIAFIKEKNPFVFVSKKFNKGRHQQSVDIALHKAAIGERVEAADLPITNKEFMEIDPTPPSNATAIQRTQAEELAEFQAKFKDIQDTTPNKLPEYELNTLPQQIVQKVEKGKKLHKSQFAPEELQMLNSAGVKPNARGEFPKKALQGEFDKRVKAGAFTDIPRHDTSHIDAFRRAADKPNPEIGAVKKDAEANATVTDKLDEDVKSIDVQQDLLKRADSPQRLAAEELDFDRLLKDDPNLEITFENQSVKLKDLVKEFETDEKMVQQISICAVGKK